MSQSEIIQVLKRLFNASKYSDDMAYDLKLIYSDRIYHYGKNADKFELDRIMQHYELLSEFTVTPAENNRIYVVTGMECLMAVCADVSDKSIEKIIGCLRLETALSDEFPSDTLEPNFITTIYVFTGSKVVYSVDLPPYWIGVLVQSLRRKNVIRHGESEYWLKD